MKWISVKERLPEEGDKVLVFTSEDRDIFTAHYKGLRPDRCKSWNDEQCYKIFILGSSQLECCICKYITHWAPMPDLPEEK